MVSLSVGCVDLQLTSPDKSLNTLIGWRTKCTRQEQKEHKRFFHNAGFMFLFNDNLTSATDIHAFCWLACDTASTHVVELVGSYGLRRGG